MITLLFLKMCWPTSWFHLIKSFSLSSLFEEKMMKFNIRKKTLTSWRKRRQLWRHLIIWLDDENDEYIILICLSFSWLIMSGNEVITVEGGDSKASPSLGRRKQKKDRSE